MLENAVHLCCIKAEGTGLSLLRLPKRQQGLSWQLWAILETVPFLGAASEAPKNVGQLLFVDHHLLKHLQGQPGLQHMLACCGGNPVHHVLLP